MNWKEFADSLDPEESPLRKGMLLGQMERIMNLAILEWSDEDILFRVKAICEELRAKEEWAVVE